MDIPPQFIVGRFQLGNGLLQRFGQFVDILAQIGNLGPARPLVFGAEIQLFHTCGNLRQFTDGPCDGAGQDHGHDRTDGCNDQAHPQEEAVGQGRAVMYALQRRPQQEIAAVLQAAPHFQGLLGSLAVQNDIQHIIVLILDRFENAEIIGVHSVFPPEFSRLICRRFLAGVLSFALLAAVSVGFQFLFCGRQAQQVVPHPSLHGIGIRSIAFDRHGVLVHDDDAYIIFIVDLDQFHIKIVG